MAVDLNPNLIPTGSVVLLAYRNVKQAFGNDMNVQKRQLWGYRLGSDELMSFANYGEDDATWAEIKDGMKKLMSPARLTVVLGDGSVMKRDDSESM